MIDTAPNGAPDDLNVLWTLTPTGGDEVALLGSPATYLPLDGGDVRITTSVGDSSGGLLTVADRTLTVTAVNDAPVIVGNGPLTVTEDTTSPVKDANDKFLQITDTDYYLKAYLSAVAAYPDIQVLADDYATSYQMSDFPSCLPRVRFNVPKGNIPSDKQKCQPKEQHEFTIKGIKVMSASKKNAIKKYNHHKK